MSTLTELCRRIEAGYAAERTMYDGDMPALAEELTSRTAEIRQVVERAERLTELAAKAATDLRDLRTGYQWWELHDGSNTLRTLVRFLRDECGIDDGGGWDCDVTAKED